MKIELISYFSEMLEIITITRLNKCSSASFNQEHKECIKKINSLINKNQKSLLNHSELTSYLN